MSMINQFKDVFVIGHVLLSMFDPYNNIPLELILLCRNVILMVH